MTTRLPYRFVKTTSYTTEPRYDNVRWLDCVQEGAMRVHEGADHRFHWTFFFYEHSKDNNYDGTDDELCFIGSCDIPAEEAGYDTKALAVAGVMEYYQQLQWRKVGT